MYFSYTKILTSISMDFWKTISSFMCRLNDDSIVHQASASIILFIDDVLLGESSCLHPS